MYMKLGLSIEIFVPQLVLNKANPKCSNMPMDINSGQINTIKLNKPNAMPLTDFFCFCPNKRIRISPNFLVLF